MAVPALSPFPTKTAPLPDAAPADARVSPEAAEAFRSALETAGALPAAQADGTQAGVSGAPVGGIPAEAQLLADAPVAVEAVPAEAAPPVPDDAALEAATFMPEAQPGADVPVNAGKPADTLPETRSKPVRHKDAAAQGISTDESATALEPGAPGVLPVAQPATAAASPTAPAAAEAQVTRQRPETAHGAAVAAATADAASADAGAAVPASAPEPRVSAPLFSQTLEATTARHTALPYAAAPAPAAEASVALREGRFGTDVGVAIARALDGGPDGLRETLLIRLDPRDMGRVDVRMSFEHDGTLRAVVSADSPVALDMLRRESTHLDRALSDAGVRADAQSLRFDGSGGGAGQNRQGGRPQGQMPQGGGQTDFSGVQDGAEPSFRSLRGSGHVDLMA